MNIREISRPLTAKALNESLAKHFGKRINLEAFTLDQLQDARNKLRTKLSTTETTESYSSVQKGDYQKNKLFLDVLNAEIAEREEYISQNKAISEGAEDEAEIVMAAKDMVDRLTGWMEDTAEMQTESMLELADAIRDEMGSEQSERFTGAIKPALESLYQAMEQTRTVLTQGVSTLTGEGGMEEPMGMDDGEADIDTDMEPTDDMDMDADLEGGDDLDTGDDFGADDAAAGGEEAAGREKRESIERPRSKKK